MWVTDPNSPPSGWAVGGGGAPDFRRPSQRWKAPPRGRPTAAPTASNAGPQGRTLWNQCWVPTPAPTAPRTHGWRYPGCPPQRTGGWGEGQRLTPDAPHNSGRLPPPGTAPHHPRGTQPPQGVQAKPGREEPEPDRPPPSTRDGARDRGRTRGGARTTWNCRISATCRDRARCARHTTQGGGGRTPRERDRTHTQRARGEYQKGNRTELAERTDHVEWRTSERG